MVPFVSYSGERFEDDRGFGARGYRREGVESGIRWPGAGQLSVLREGADSLRSDGSGWSK